MVNTLLLRRSAVAGKIPTTAQLQVGELALNTTDGILYTNCTIGGSTQTIVQLGGNRSFNGDLTGTGSGSITLTLNNVNANVGTFNNVTVNSKGLVTAASNVQYATAASLAPIATSGLLTDASGVLPVARGGTGNTSFTSNGLLYGNSNGSLGNVPSPTIANTYLAWTGASFAWTTISTGSGTGGGTFGTTAGTYAQGNDVRFTAALQKTSNLSDLTNITQARTNLGLATVAGTGQYTDLIGAPTPAVIAPYGDGTASIGSSIRYAREDHVHPASTTSTSGVGLAPINSPTFTGIVTIPAGANIAGYATVAIVTQQVGTAVSNLVGSAPAALNTIYELAAQLQSDETAAGALSSLVGSKAPINNPTFTGNVTIPAGASIANYAQLDPNTGKVLASQLPASSGGTPTPTSTGGSSTQNVRVVTASTTMLSTDGVLLCNPTAPMNVTLESAPITGTTHYVKDGNGASGTYQITILGGNHTIDGVSLFALNQSRGSITLIYTGNEWSIV